MNSNILITTGDIHEDYEIIDAVFALDSCQESFFTGADPNKAFDKVKEGLRKKAASPKFGSLITLFAKTKKFF